MKRVRQLHVAAPLALALHGGVAFYCLVVWMSYRPQRERVFLMPGQAINYFPSVPRAAINAWALWLAILPVFLFAAWLTVVAARAYTDDRRSLRPA